MQIDDMAARKLAAKVLYQAIMDYYKGDDRIIHWLSTPWGDTICGLVDIEPQYLISKLKSNSRNMVYLRKRKLCRFYQSKTP